MRHDLIPAQNRLPKLNTSQLEEQIRSLIGSPQGQIVPVSETDDQQPYQTCDRITHIREKPDGTREVEVRENVRFIRKVSDE